MRILVLSCRGGHGHTTAARAIKQALVPAGHKVIVHDLHPLQSRAYNVLQRLALFGPRWLQTHRLLNALFHLRAVYGFFTFPFAKREAAKAIDAYAPDLVISVVRGNGPVWAAARDFGVPFIVVPTDLDVGPFLEGVNRRPGEVSATCAYAVGTPVPSLSRAWVHCEPVGFPVRRAFRGERPAAKWKERPLVVFLGYDFSDDFKYLLEHCSFNVEVRLLCGGNSKLYNDVSGFYQYANHRVCWGALLHTVDATYLSWLMRHADLVVTKPGGSTMSEAYVSGAAVAAKVDRVVAWEKRNTHLAEVTCIDADEVLGAIDWYAGEARRANKQNFGKRMRALVQRIYDDHYAWPALAAHNEEAAVRAEHPDYNLEYDL